MKLTLVIYWVKNTKMPKKHLTRNKITNKHKDKQSKNLLKNNKTERKH